MDELRMIRSFLDEAPPSDEVVAEGRRRLTVSPPRRVALAPRRRIRLWGTLAAAGAAATAVALVVTLSGGGPARTGQPELVRALTARQVLLTAAGKAAAAPVGRYWHTHVISSEGYHIDDGDYMIFGARHEIDQWLARSDQDPDVFRSRFRGAEPQTPADRAAWKRAGSPTQWRVISNGDRIPQSVRSGPWDLQRTSPADKRAERKQDAETAKHCAAYPKACRLLPPGPKQREALAHDPQGLRRYLLRAAGNGESSYLLNMAGEFLLNPSSPQLRSAVFRILAGEPGVRSIGTGRDPLGRPAIILAQRVTQGTSAYDNELLLDPVTYMPLDVQTVLARGDGGKRMKPGAITHSEIYVAMGWTDTAYGG